MTTSSRLRRTRAGRRGAILVLSAIFMIVLFAFAAIAINLCYMQLTQTELSIATDAAARAGARELADSGDQNLAFDRAAQLAALNKVAGQPLLLSTSDIEFGTAARPSSTSRFSFSPTSTNPNALRVIGNRTASSASGPVTLYMGNMVGTTTFEPRANAVAAAVMLDVCLVVDRSGSMVLEPDEEFGTGHPRAADLNQNGQWDQGEWQVGDPPPIPGNSRWEALQIATNSFFSRLNATYSIERVAVVSFSSDATPMVDFTSDYSLIQYQLNSVSPTGWTAVGEGMYTGLNMFLTSRKTRPGAARLMIVLTDGFENSGRPSSEAAAAIAAQGITIHAIGFSPSASSATVNNIAQIGGGMAIQADNNSQLTAAFNKIADALPVLLIE